MSSLRRAMLDVGKRSLRFIPDETFLRIYYRLRLGKRLNLRDPQKFSEKLQWLKLHDRNPLYTTLADKHEVKAWVSRRAGDAYVVPTYGVWDAFNEIDFAALPSQFVLKCTHDSGGLSICRDKSTFDFEEARKKIESSLRINYYHLSREWPYKNIQPRIIAEKYLGEEAPPAAGDRGNQMVDYKFYCFNGVPKFLYVSQGLERHDTALRAFLSLDWTRTSFVNHDYAEFEALPPCPSSYEEMLSLARLLSGGIPFVRVDLYEVAGRALFSEMTFYPTGGFMSLNPSSWDYKIGSWIDLEQVRGQEPS